MMGEVDIHRRLPLIIVFLLNIAAIGSVGTPVTMLDDINIIEGTPGGQEYRDIHNMIIHQRNYPEDYSYYDGVTPTSKRNVFYMHFSVGETGIITTTPGRLVSRDDIAVALRQHHLPVSFNVSVIVADEDYNTVETFTVVLRIIDTDNNVPVFRGYEDRAFELQISEGASNSGSTTIPPATDNDEGLNAIHSYTLTDSIGGLFELQVRSDSDSGFITGVRLVQNEKIDREVREEYHLQIVATEGNSNPDSATLLVNITVLDVCDERPTFPITRYTPEVRENSPVNTTILPNVTAEDRDSMAVIYYIISLVCSQKFEGVPPCVPLDVSHSPFHLDRESGELTITQELDREEFAQYVITILAVDNCDSSGTANVEVTVQDINDNAPNVTFLAGSSLVKEGSSTVLTAYFLFVEDADYGTSTMIDPRFTISLFDNSTGTPMSTDQFRLVLDPEQVRLKSVQSLDRETTSQYMLVMNVTDWGSPNISTLFPLPIIVTDINDNSPIFLPIDPTYPIEENLPLGRVLIQLMAMDEDSVESGSGAISYILPPNNDTFPHQHLFSIDQDGRLIVNGTIDREELESLSVLVEARDNPDESSGMSRSDFIIVNLTVMDVNDNVPMILTPRGTVTLPESQEVNSVIFTVTAIDNDTEQYSTLRYSMTPSDLPFQINPTTGTVILVRPLDYETDTSYTLTVIASDLELEGNRTVTVLVRDENDERCVFDRNGQYSSVILETKPANFHVVHIQASDRDTPSEDLRFGIEAGNDRGDFSIGTVSGEILTTTSLDHEMVSNYTLIVSCNDGSPIPTEMMVFIRVSDFNDNHPLIIGGRPYNFSISENLPVGSVVDAVQATDDDSSQNGAVRYRILDVVPSSVASWFELNEVTGIITTTQVLNREASELRGVPNTQVILNVEAYDMPENGTALFNTTLVYIQITDVNDKPPVFETSEVTIELPENYEVGRDFPIRIHATDDDIYPNNVIFYEISGRSSLNASLFRIYADTGILRLTSTLDFETQERHTFNVEAIDSNKRNLRDTQTVTIIVQNVPENNLTFVGFVPDVSLSENAAFNKTVTQFSVTDMNQTPLLANVPRIMYWILNVDGSIPVDFGIRNDTDNSRLIVYVKGNIDREGSPPGATVMRVFNITARDPNASERSHGSHSAILTVTILDENDNRPIFDRPSYSFDVTENNDASTFIGRVTATDIDFDRNGTLGITYHIPPSFPFQIADNGEVRTTEQLDREMNSEYQFTVVASDGGSPAMSSGVPVRVNVIDLNDNRPEFDQTQNQTFFVREDASIGTLVDVLRASDSDSGIFGQFNISIGDAPSRHFHLEQNGSIFLIKSLDREEMDRHFFTAVVRDGGMMSSTVAVDIVVQDYNDNAPVFNPVRPITIPEDTPENTILETVSAEDADIGYNGIVRYSIGNYSLNRIFCIDQVHGHIRLCFQDHACIEDTDVADYERRSEYDVAIVAYDEGFPRHIVSQTVRIVIRPINEHTPAFDKELQIVYVNETQRSNIEIRAIDRDKDDQITYEVRENDQQSQLFSYDQTRGAIVSNGNLDSNHDLTLEARDSENHVSSMRVVVVAHNVNNHAPIFEPGSFPGAANQPLTISESTTVSTVVWTVRANDEDNATHDAVSYYLESENNNGRFRIDPLTGEINVSAALDFETSDSCTLRVFARDTGSPQMTSAPITLMIAIGNENDESPSFNSSQYVFPLLEKEPAGSLVGVVHAVDRDVGLFGEVLYSISEDDNNFFSIDESRGEIFANIPFDRDVLGASGNMEVSFGFRVLVTDRAPGLSVRTDTASVVVTIVDVNDNAPVFAEPQYLVRIPPDQPPFVSLATLSVVDLDEGANSEHSYVIEQDVIPLQISSRGEISLVQAIPSDYRPVYTYSVRAIDSRDSNLFSSTRVELIIETPTDHHPRFNPIRSQVSVSELTPVNTAIFQVEAVVTDQDTGNNGRLSYEFDFPNNYPKFGLRDSGEIYLREMLDFEGVRSYNLVVLARDARPVTRRTATGMITVTVQPGNEYAPQFVGLPLEFTLSHLPVIGLELFTVQATDQDEGTDGDVAYNIIHSEFEFSIDINTGVLRNKGILNTDATYNVTIEAYDLGAPLLSSNATVCITIQNNEEAAPRFIGNNPTTFARPEAYAANTFLNSALSTHPQAQSFHIAKQTVLVSGDSTEMFSITESEGRLTALMSLDYEDTIEYSIIVESRIETRLGTTVRRMSDFLVVTLMVTDVNDNIPLFSLVDDQIISEDTEVGTSLFRVHAIDNDSGLEGTVSYNIIQERTFRINSTTGEVTLNQPLDRESVSSYDLVIQARDLSNDPESSQITVHVTVADVNDFVTTYGNRNFSLGVYEFPHTQSGERIVKLSATDEDLGPLMYTLNLVEASYRSQPSDVSSLQGTFVIQHNSGLISVGTTMTLDRETVDHYLLQVTASDRTNIAVTYLSITILDVNDNPPVVTVPEERIELWEGQPAGMLVTDRIQVSDADIGINSWVKYSLGGGWPSEDYFRIDPLSGVIRTNNVIVARDMLSYEGIVIVEDQGINRHRTTVTVPILIVDINDHPPMFEGESIELSISMTASVGTTVHLFEVTDEDLNVNAIPVMFSIPNYYVEARNNFAIGYARGLLTLREQQDEVRSYNFVIHASNPNHVPRCVEFDQASSINVTVNIRPVNTACPQFSLPAYSAEVDEETEYVGSLVQVTSNDPDGDAVVYSFSDPSVQAFDINRQTGAITLTATLDREAVGSYSLTVLATDDGFPSMNCSTVVTVTVLDINDHSPVFEQEEYMESIEENSAVNFIVTQVAASDLDLGEAARVEYQLSSRNEIPFEIDIDTGEIFTTQTLDYDTLLSDTYTFSVVASDNGEPSASSSVPVVIRVTPVNEESPVFDTQPTEPIQVVSGMVQGTPIAVIMASDADRGTELLYSFLDPKPTCYFNLNNRTGEVTLKANANSGDCTCSDNSARRQSDNPQYFIIDTSVMVSDGEFTDTVDVSFMIHESFTACNAPPALISVEIIAATITGVLAVVLIFVCFIVFACICRARRHSKIKINDTSPQSMELRKRFGSGRSSAANTPAPVYKQTNIGVGALPHEHTTMTIPHSSGSGTSSTRQSYTCGGDVEADQNDRISYPSPGGISRKSQLSKSYRSTSDLGSNTVATLGESQEIAPYPKAQIDKIYAKNADLLNQSDSNESIHMFGSEGGGESDGGDDMLFAKFDDLDDDDDSTTMQDDEDDRSYQRRSLPSSRDNLNVPPVMDDDAYAFEHPTGMTWAPRVNNMADTIDQMAVNSYDAQEHIRQGQHYVGEFNKSQEGVSMYGASTQESTRPLLRHPHPHPHPHPQSRIPLQHLVQPGPEFYPYSDGPEDVRHHGLPMYPAHDLPPRGHPMARHGGGGGASQEVPVPYGHGYHGDFMHHHPMHHEMGVNHSPSSSTPTEGTLNTRPLTNEYESDMMYSSDTSINTNTESDPPHIRGFSQSGHSQRHPYH